MAERWRKHFDVNMFPIYGDVVHQYHRRHILVSYKEYHLLKVVNVVEQFKIFCVTCIKVIQEAEEARHTDVEELLWEGGHG